MQEISQQLMSLFAKNTFWMELHTFQIHWRWRIPIISRVSLRAVTSKHAGNGVRFHHQRMVACHGKWICQPRNTPSPLCVIGEVLPCMTFAARTTLPPNACAICLMTEADAKNRQAPGIVANNVKGDPGFIWRTGAGWDDNFCGLRASISASVNASLRLTSTSAPSSQKYW